MEFMKVAEGEPPHEGDSMKADLCVRNHSPEVISATGNVLCVSCVRQVERHLRTLPGLHRESLHQVSPTARGTNPTRVSGSRRRDHLNISVIDARSRVLAVLESWSDVVAEKAGVAVPGRSVPELARFLAQHLQWFASVPPGADFADELESLVAEVRGTIDPGPGGAGALVRACVVDGCGGTISVSPGSGGAVGASSIGCSSGHSWEMPEWLELRQLMERQRKGVRA
ncbi:hypothetical protein [Streptomyces asoensis]|nr:hypothetical protein [Streptomyces asoensis]